MAIIVNASGEYLRRTANLPSDSAWTGMCWMYLNSIRSSVYQYLIELANATSSASSYQVIGFNSSGSFEIHQGVSSQTFGSAPSAGAWYHVYLRNNGTTLSGGFRAVGASAYTTASISSASAFTEAALYFGNDSWDEYMDARLAAIKVWDAHLSDAEIELEFMRLTPARTANLNIWTPGILTGTDRVKDYSGNGRDWTAGGTLTDGDGPPVPWGTGPIIVLPVTVTSQKLAPVSDVAAGSWTPSSGSDLYAMLDETAASDTDYIQATSATTCTLALASGSDPSSSTGHILRYRLLAGSGKIAVTLKQSTTTIASWGPHTLTGAAQDFAQTLTSGEADSITDYSALRVEFTSALA